MSETQFEHEMKDPEMRRLYAQERLAEEAAELVCAAMERHRIDKAELARKSKITSRWLDSLLADDMGLRNLAHLMHAMGERVVLSSEPEQK